jgi:hypothetical protein
MDAYSTATTIAVLMGGRTPVWSTQDAVGSGSPPSLPTDGVVLQGAVKALAHVQLRDNPAYRSAIVSVSTLVLTSTYTVTINGTSVAYDANAGGAVDLEDVVDGIAAAINANVTAAAVVTASSYAASGTGARDRVKIVGDSAEDWSISVTAGGGAGLECVADLTGALVQTWWVPGARAGSMPPAIWSATEEAYVADRRGYLERLDCAGLDRMYLQVYDKAGHPRDGAMVTYRSPVISIGPCLSEVEF